VRWLTDGEDGRGRLESGDGRSSVAAVRVCTGGGVPAVHRRLEEVWQLLRGIGELWKGSAPFVDVPARRIEAAVGGAEPRRPRVAALLVQGARRGGGSD
jgi:hypothetical protein